MSSPLFLCLVLPEFPAQALLRLRPALHGSPVAVMDGNPPLETVASANRQARRLGVARGMRKTELSSFPALTLLRRSAAEEQSAHSAAVDIVSTLTPRMEEATSSEKDGGSLVLVLDISGSERLFGPPAAIARTLLDGLRSVRLHARCAISSNFSASVCLARAASRAITVVAPGAIASSLASLPLAALPLLPEQAETLALWGLRSLGEFAALPLMDIVSRLGSSGEYLHQLARGTASHLMIPAESPLSLEETIEFDSPVDTIDSLLFVLGPMLDALIARAAAHALELSSVTAHMTLEQFTATSDSSASEPPVHSSTHTRTLKPALPVADRRLLLKLFQLDLAAHPPSAGVLLLRLTAEPGARSKVQAGLFAPQTPEPMRLEVTLARLAALVGEGRAGRPQLSDSHAPESFTVERFTVPEMPPSRIRNRRPRSSSSDSNARRNTSRPHVPVSPLTNPSAGETLTPSLSTGPQKTLAPRTAFSAKHAAQLPAAHHSGIALRRFRPPVPISPRSESGILLAFYFQGTRYEVRERFGPWRRSGHWWSGEIWSREEWDVHAEAARPASRSHASCSPEQKPDTRLLCLISHDLLHDRWHMDAVYD